MPPKHKKKLTESEILESLTKPDLSIDQTAETLKDDSLKDSDDELPAIDINPTAKKNKKAGRPPKPVEHKKTEAEVLADVAAEQNEPPKPARSNRKKTATETAPVTIEPPKKTARGRAKSQADEPTVSLVEAPKRPGRKPAKKAEDEQPAKKTPQKKAIKSSDNIEEAPAIKQSKKSTSETKDVGSSTAELEEMPIKENPEESETAPLEKGKRGRPKKEQKEETTKSDSEELAVTKSKRGPKSKAAKSDTEDVLPEKPEPPKKKAGRAASQVRETKTEESAPTKTDKKTSKKEIEPKSEPTRSRKASTQKKTELPEALVEKNQEKEVPEAKKRGRKNVGKVEVKTDEPAIEDKENSEETTEKPKKKGAKGASKANAKIVIEHCNTWPVFKRRANEYITALKVHLPDMEFVTNVTKPRRNSFEFSLVIDDQEFLVWTGVKLTPRKAKFPETEVILNEIKKHLLE